MGFCNRQYGMINIPYKREDKRYMPFVLGLWPNTGFYPTAEKPEERPFPREGEKGALDMKSKRTIAILLAVGMLLGLLPAAAFAEETVPAVVEGLAVCETCGEDPCVCEEETSSEPGTEETEALEEELSLEPEIPETEEPEAPGIETEKPEEEPMTVLTLREEEPVVTGYKGEELPEGPDMNGAVVNVTPENAQYTLDGAYGTIDGKTVHFTAGNYDALELGRTTKYAGSGTKYYKGGNTNNEEIGIDNVAGTGTRTYVRTMSNVTFTADSGAALGGFYGGTGHHYGDSYDYVRDTPTVNTNTSYYVWWTMENITFDGLTIEGKFDFACSGTQTDVDGITFQDCKFTGTGTASTVGAAIRMQTDLADCYRNITVDGCEFTNYFQGLFTQGLENVTVRDCNFTTMGHNAIALQNGASNTVRGTVEISGNTFTEGKDRAIRFGNIGENAEITVSRNTAVDFADADGEVMKAGTVDSSASITIEENNDWNGGHVHDALLPVAKIGNKSYSTLQAAIAAANAVEGTGQVSIVLLKDCAPTGNDQLRLTRDNVTLDGGGFTIACGEFSCSGQAGLLVSGDNVTVKNLTVTTAGANGNVSALKATKVDNDGARLVSGLNLDGLTLNSAAGHGLNLHGVEGAKVTGVTATGKKCGLSLANAVDVTVSGSELTGTWGSVGMMYKENEPAYANPVSLTLGDGNTFTGVVYAEAGDGRDTVKVAGNLVAEIMGALVEGGEKLTTNAPVKIRREGGEIYYATLQTAVSAARDGDVVTVLKDIDEDVTLPLRSITLTSQGESKPVLSGKMDFAAGEMPEGAQVTIENLAFENTRIMLVTWGKTAGLDKMGGLTIRDNTFTGTPSGTDTIYAVHINNADNALNNLTVTGNVFTDCGTGSGGAVYATVCGELVVTGNEFRNSSMNALTLTGKDSGGQVATSAVISENVFENWAAKPVDRHDGRAMRLSGFECDMDLTENSFVSGNLPEEYIKLTGLAEGKRADVNQCYWGGGAPEEGKLLGLGPVVSYYTTEAMEKSLTLTPAAVSVQVGSTAALTAASGTMGGTVVWSTDKAAVATVSEKGVVTGVGAGSATITASLGAVTASCTVTVTPAGSGGSTGGGSSRPSRPVEEELEEPEVPLVPALPFADVAEGDWFLEAVRFVYQRDMMKGTNEEGTLFDPQTATTRGMIVTILHRLEGEPEADGAAFSDVTEGEWYSGAVNWAAENGVVKGYDDGTFRPEGIITREETAAILSRYATFKGYDKTAKGNMEYYNDKTLISDWAQEDMVWAVGAKLLSGKENGLLDPQGATSRAEAAQMLKNFCEGFEKK